MSLGELLKQHRKNKGLKVRQVLDLARLDYSVSLYSHWENNLKIPLPADLKELCHVLGIDLKQALFLWAESHMPTPYLKEFFHQDLTQTETPLPIEAETIAYPSSITQQINELDAHWFVKKPLAADILVKTLMLTNQNTNSSVEVLSEILNASMDAVQHLCEELKKRKYLVSDGQNYRTKPGIKYLYLPETPEFEEMRRSRIKSNFDRTLETITPNMISDRQAMRLTLFKKMPDDKISLFVNRIESLANDIVSRVDSKADNSKYYQFVCVFGPE